MMRDMTGKRSAAGHGKRPPVYRRLLLTLATLAVAAWLLTSAPGCGGKKDDAQPPSGARRGRVPTVKGKYLICVTDVSGSMRRNDPDRYAEQGAQLAVALLGPETYFGAVAFNARAWMQRPLRPLGSGGGRQAAQKAVCNVPRSGGTDFSAALQLTRHMLGEVAAGSTGAVIFLTDGKSDKGERALRDLQYFERRRVPIFTIALGDKADAQLMQQIAGRTGGAFFRADRGDDLLTAFVDIVGGIEDLFIRRGPFEPATVMPGTRRLIFMIAKEKADQKASGGVPTAEIVRVRCDGRMPAARNTMRFPAKLKGRGGRSAVEVVAYDGPGEGVWTAEGRGRISEWLTIQQPPFTLEVVAGQPRPRYVDGQTVKLGLRASADEAFVLLDLDARLRVQAQVTSETTGRLLAAMPMEAQPRPLNETAVVFGASMQAELGHPGVEATTVPIPDAPEDLPAEPEREVEPAAEGEGEPPADDEAALDEILGEGEAHEEEGAEEGEEDFEEAPEEPAGEETEAPGEGFEEAPVDEAAPEEGFEEPAGPAEEAPAEEEPAEDEPAEEAPDEDAPADEAGEDRDLFGEGFFEDDDEEPADEAPEDEDVPDTEAPDDEAPEEDAAGDEVGASPGLQDIARALTAAGEESDAEPGAEGTPDEEELLDEEPAEDLLDEEVADEDHAEDADEIESEPLQDETFTAHFRCLLKWGPGDNWVHERRVAFMVVPPTDFYTVQPEELLFGTLWSDEEAGTLDLSLLAHEGQVQAAVSTDDAFVSVDPKEVLIEDGEEQTVAVGVDVPAVVSDVGLGSARGQVTVDLVLVDDPAHSAKVAVPVMLRVHECATEDIDLGIHKAGISIEESISHSANPPLGFVYSLTPLVLAPEEDEPTEAEESDAEGEVDEGEADEGGTDESEVGEGEAAAEGLDAGQAEEEDEEPPVEEPAVEDEAADGDAATEESAAEVELKLNEGPEGWAITGLIVPETPPGTYVGTLTLTFEPPGIVDGFGWPEPTPRKVGVRLTVAPPNAVLTVTRPEDETAAPLETVALEVAEPGWAEFDIRMEPKWVGKGAAYIFEPTDLVSVSGGLVAQRFCVRSAPRGEWDGKTVDHGKTYDLAYRVHVSSDLIDGEYAGEVVLAIASGEERAVEVKLPVTVHVKIGNVGEPAAPPEAPEEAPEGAPEEAPEAGEEAGEEGAEKEPDALLDTAPGDAVVEPVHDAPASEEEPAQEAPTGEGEGVEEPEETEEPDETEEEPAEEPVEEEPVEEDQEDIKDPFEEPEEEPEEGPAEEPAAEDEADEEVDEEADGEAPAEEEEGEGEKETDVIFFD
jgi:Mg-chelatase subunit ChlD